MKGSFALLLFVILGYMVKFYLKRWSILTNRFELPFEETYQII